MSRKVAEKLTDEQMKKYLQNRLGELMAEKNMNQTSLESITGIARQNLAKYLTGKALPNSYTLYSLAYALDTTCDYLLGYEHGTTHDRNYIVEETGLSEKAINQLSEYVNGNNVNKENLFFAINQILENKKSNSFFLSFARYTAVPNISEYDFSDEYFYNLYIKYEMIKADNNVYDLQDGFDMINKEDIIYHQLMKSFSDLLNSIKNNDKTRKEYIRWFEEKTKYEHDEAEILFPFIDDMPVGSIKF